MKYIIFGMLLFVLVLAGCSPAASTTETSQTKLAVSGGSITKSYTASDLQKLSSTKATLNNVEYVGVTLSSLLKDAGFDQNQVKTVKVVASDGFTTNYDPSLFNKEDTLVAYALSSSALSADDGVFRMVLPGQPGKLNPRKVVEIQVTQ
jgi:DMSO/TMAO reductase YedYZ molybdopterin-dependent catalytic subunit